MLYRLERKNVGKMHNCYKPHLKKWGKCDIYFKSDCVELIQQRRRHERVESTSYCLELSGSIVLVFKVAYITGPEGTWPDNIIACGVPIL